MSAACRLQVMVDTDADGFLTVSAQDVSRPFEGGETAGVYRYDSPSCEKGRKRCANAPWTAAVITTLRS